MGGTLLNVLAIIAGTLLGMLIGNRLPEKIQSSVMTCLGLTTTVIALDGALGTGNILIPLLALVSGTIIGELLNVDGALNALGGWLQRRVAGAAHNVDHTDHSGAALSSTQMGARVRFINGFVTASLVFCIGPLAILGSIQNGMDANDIRLLAIKSTLDFFASMAFASSLGIGVGFSALPVGLVQGAFALVGIGLARVAGAGAALGPDNPYIREFSATGGLILLGLSLILLDIKRPRIANFLPALLVVPLLIWLAGLLGIPIYPL